jgi:hypothetical protein
MAFTIGSDTRSSPDYALSIHEIRSDADILLTNA